MQTPHGSELPRGPGRRGHGLLAGVWQWCRQRLGRIRNVLHSWTSKRERHRRTELEFDEWMAEHGLPQPMMRVLPTEPLPNPLAAVGLVLVATAAVVVSVTALLMVALHSSPPGRLIMTGTHESIAAHFGDGSVVLAGANAAARVNITEQQRNANVIVGEFTFTVPDLTTDFWLDTPVVQARIAEAASFRVVVSQVSVDVDVYEGTLLFYEAGLSPEAPVRQVRKGQSYHKSVNSLAAVFSVPASSVSESRDVGSGPPPSWAARVTAEMDSCPGWLCDELNVPPRFLRHGMRSTRALCRSLSHEFTQ